MNRVHRGYSARMEDSLQTWREAATVSKKESRTSDKG
jgi:hypothetical protein